MQELVKPENLIIMGVLAPLFAAMQATPAGWIADVILIGLGGWGVVNLIKTFIELDTNVKNARCEPDIDAAAKALASQLVKSAGEIAGGAGGFGALKAGGAFTRVGKGIRSLFEFAKRRELSLLGRPGVLVNANFAQRASKLNKVFSDEGIAKYTDLAGRPIKTVNDLKEALINGTIRPSQVPIDFVDLNGTRLILNTRTSTALEQAGIPRTDWYGIDKTNVLAYEGVTFSDLAAQQLKRNGYSSTGRP